MLVKRLVETRSTCTSAPRAVICTASINLRQRDLYGMSDANWATRHSTSGRVFVLNKAAISWGSKKQDSVALSSCEAEIVSEIMSENLI